MEFDAGCIRRVRSQGCLRGTRGTSEMDFRLRVSTAAGLFLAIAGIALGATAPEPADRERAEARELERLGDWGRASEVYLRLLGEDRNQLETRERLTLCLHHLRQTRRHADPVYRSYVAALPLSQAIGLYAEVLTTIQQNYVSGAQSTLDKLYHHGLDELRFALSDATFSREHLAGVEAGALAEFRQRVDTFWSAKTLDDLRDARQVVRHLAREAQQLVGVNPSVIALEFACGACEALDEYTQFISPGRAILDAGSVNVDLAAFGLTTIAKDDGLVVERVVLGSWAAGIGLISGDQILRVGKVRLDRLSLD